MTNDNLISALRNMVDDIENLGAAPFTVDVNVLRQAIAALTPPEGYVLVPVEPTTNMVEAAAEAYMPFGDMEMALKMAIMARPGVSP